MGKNLALKLKNERVLREAPGKAPQAEGASAEASGERSSWSKDYSL